MLTRRLGSWMSMMLLLAACSASSSPNEPSVAAPSPTPSTASIGDLRLRALTIDEPDWKATGANWALVLSWRAPEGAVIGHYEVARDGVTVDDAVIVATFRDGDVEPGARYRYEIVGVGTDGTETLPATVSIKTAEPPLSDARLEGTFIVRMAVDRASGTKNPARGGAVFFEFDPACDTGPCAVRWTVRKARTDGRLRRDDAVYAAKLRTPLFVRNCLGAVVDEALEVHMRVTAAAPLRGRWRATRIEGSIEEVSSYGGCVTATIDWNVRGSLQS
jgi:hypothetical protein